MKKLLVLGLLAGLVFSACSNDDSLNENNNSNQYNMVEGQPSFLSLGIAMPGDDRATRGNDNYQDGVAAEYSVKTGMLVLFKGTNESSAKLFGNYNITDAIKESTDWSLEGTTTDQVTTTSKKFVQEITNPKLTASEKLYAYVILNTANVTGLDYTLGQTFDVFSKQVLKAIGIADETKGFGTENTTNGFVMTNTTYCTAGGGSAAPTTGAEIKSLAEIKSEAVYPTKAEAEASEAKVACIYVERAAVKVEVTYNAGGATITDPAGSTSAPDMVGWELGNVNNGGASGSGYYNVRQFDAAWMPYINAQASTAATKYRFVTVAPFFASDHAAGYRTYFGKDVNYDGKTGLINSKVADGTGKYALTSGAITYTYENTFDENSQIYENTTYVAFKFKLNGGNDFYTIAGQENTAYITKELMEAKLVELADAQLSPSVKAELNSKIAAALGTHYSGHSVTFTYAPKATISVPTESGTASYTLELGFTSVKVDGSEKYASDKSTIDALIYEGATTISDKFAALVGTFKFETVTYYKDGVTYYATRIAHFGNAETPWDAPNEAHNNYAKIYPSDGQSLHTPTPINYGTDRANAWLGRWGIVRNNWYSLNVSNITGIGDAVPVDYSGNTTPDDNPDPKYYIAAHIHILPWVKRTQDVVLMK